MRWGRSVLLSVGGAVLSLVPRASHGDGAVGGRVVFRAGGRIHTVREAETAVGGARIALEARRRGDVVEARIDPEGRFVFEGPPGTYRLEYVLVGERAEFFAPQELQLTEGALVCAGTLTLDLRRIEYLGANVDNEVSIADDCDRLLPRLRTLSAGGGREQVALARRGPQYETDEPLDVRVVLVRFRWEVGLAFGGAAAVRGLYRHALAGLSFGSVIAELDAGGQWHSGWSYEVALGAGLSLLGLFDVLALGGYRHVDSASGAQAGGPILRGRLRLTTNLFGIGVLGEVLPERSWLVTFDLVPLGILGSLL